MSYETLMRKSQRTSVVDFRFNDIGFSVGEHSRAPGKKVLIAHFGEVEVPVIEETSEIMAGAFGIPFKFVKDLEPNTQRKVFEDRGRYNRDKNYHWGVDIPEAVVNYCGPSNKPVVPLHSVGEVLENKGFEMNGETGRGGTGILVGTHPMQGLIEPRVGDITRSGVRIQLNPTMEDNPVIIPWSYRLACLNGMGTTEERPKVYVVGHDVDDVLSQIDALADTVFRTAEVMNQNFAEMNNHPVDLETAVRNMTLAHDVPTRIREKMIQEAVRLARTGSDWTLYDAMNIITQIATHEIEDPAARFRVQSLAGNIVQDDELHCSHCGSNIER